MAKILSCSPDHVLAVTAVRSALTTYLDIKASLVLDFSSSFSNILRTSGERSGNARRIRIATSEEMGLSKEQEPGGTRRLTAEEKTIVVCMTTQSTWWLGS